MVSMVMSHYTRVSIISPPHGSCPCPCCTPSILSVCLSLFLSVTFHSTLSLRLNVCVFYLRALSLRCSRLPPCDYCWTVVFPTTITHTQIVFGKTKGLEGGGGGCDSIVNRLSVSSRDKCALILSLSPFLEHLATTRNMSDCCYPLHSSVTSANGAAAAATVVASSPYLIESTQHLVACFCVCVCVCVSYFNCSVILILIFIICDFNIFFLP